MRRKFWLAAAAAVTLVAGVELLPSAAWSAGASTAQCPGGTMMTAVSSRQLPQGSTAYKYVQPDGTSFENIAPPAGFNIATASNALLAELNLPPRPTAAAAVKDWGAEVAAFNTSAIDGTEVFCQEAPAEPNPATTGAATGVVPLGADGHDGHTFWGGYELRSGPYRRAVGHITEPTISGVTSNAAMFNWIGLWGTGSGSRLVQAGTENEKGNPGVAYPFWELYCSSGTDCTGANVVTGDTSGNSYKIYPGDDVSVNVSFDPSLNTSYYQVAIRGKLVINVPWQLNPGTNTGSVADFITERITSPSILNVPYFNTLQFSSSRTYATFNSSAYVWFGAQNYHAYEMTGDGNFYSPPCSASSEILVYPNNVSTGGFVNNWCNYVGYPVP